MKKPMQFLVTPYGFLGYIGEPVTSLRNGTRRRVHTARNGE